MPFVAFSTLDEGFFFIETYFFNLALFDVVIFLEFADFLFWRVTVLFDTFDASPFLLTIFYLEAFKSTETVLFLVEFLPLAA